MQPAPTAEKLEDLRHFREALDDREHGPCAIAHLLDTGRITLDDFYDYCESDDDRPARLMQQEKIRWALLTSVNPAMLDIAAKRGANVDEMGQCEHSPAIELARHRRIDSLTHLIGNLHASPATDHLGYNLWYVLLTQSDLQPIDGRKLHKLAEAVSGNNGPGPDAPSPSQCTPLQELVASVLDIHANKDGVITKRCVRGIADACHLAPHLLALGCDPNFHGAPKKSIDNSLTQMSEKIAQAIDAEGLAMNFAQRNQLPQLITGYQRLGNEHLANIASACQYMFDLAEKLALGGADISAFMKDDDGENAVKSALLTPFRESLRARVKDLIALPPPQRFRRMMEIRPREEFLLAMAIGDAPELLAHRHWHGYEWALLHLIRQMPAHYQEKYANAIDTVAPLRESGQGPDPQASVAQLAFNLMRHRQKENT